MKSVAHRMKLVLIVFIAFLMQICCASETTESNSGTIAEQKADVKAIELNDKLPVTQIQDEVSDKDSKIGEISAATNNSQAENKNGSEKITAKDLNHLLSVDVGTAAVEEVLHWHPVSAVSYQLL